MSRRPTGRRRSTLEGRSAPDVPRSCGSQPAHISLTARRAIRHGRWRALLAHEGPPTRAFSPCQLTNDSPYQVSPHGGTYRLQAQLVSGPPPAGTLTLFSREIPLAPMGGSPVGSVP